MPDLDCAGIRARLRAIDDAVTWVIERDEHPYESNWVLSGIGANGEVEPLGTLGFADVAAFIVATRTDVPALLDRITELEKLAQDYTRVMTERDNLQSKANELEALAARRHDETQRAHLALALAGGGADPNGYYAGTPGARVQELLTAETERDNLRREQAELTTDRDNWIKICAAADDRGAQMRVELAELGKDYTRVMAERDNYLAALTRGTLDTVAVPEKTVDQVHAENEELRSHRLRLMVERDHWVQQVENARSTEDTLRQHILDIDAHATPYGDLPDEPGYVGTYLVTAGALHRALGKIGHTAPKCQAEATVEAMRPVVDAAVAFVAADRALLAHPEQVTEESADALHNALGEVFVTVDVYLGAQPCICRPAHRPDDPICQYRQARPGDTPGGMVPGEGDVAEDPELLDRQAARDAAGHAYTSTACYHGEHQKCRRTCKHCSAPCRCGCGHPEPATWTGEGCCRAAYDSEGKRHDHTVEARDPASSYSADLGPDASKNSGDVRRDGLDAAVEAACQAAWEDNGTRAGWHEALSSEQNAYRGVMTAAVRAAAPHIRRAVLLEASDEVERSKASARQFWDVHDWAHVQAATRVAKLLRKRAEREVAS